MAAYLIINLLVIAGLVPAIWRNQSLFNRHWLVSLIVLLIMTAVFDNLIIGFSIVGYTPERILGIHIGIAPIEDFFYALAALFIIPILWHRGDSHE